MKYLARPFAGIAPILVLVGAVVVAILASARTPAGDTSFVDRVRDLAAVERVYYAHRDGASVPFERAMPAAVLEAKCPHSSIASGGSSATRKSTSLP